MKPVTVGNTRDALQAQLRIKAGHILDCLYWGSWTLAADLAEEIRAKALEIRRMETEPEKFEHQDLLDLLAPAPKQAELLNFPTDVPHTSSARVQAAVR